MGVIPHMSASRNCGPRRFGIATEKGCVRAVHSCATFVCGTDLSLTGASGIPFRRSRTKISPCFVASINAGLGPPGGHIDQYRLSGGVVIPQIVVNQLK